MCRFLKIAVLVVGLCAIGTQASEPMSWLDSARDTVGRMFAAVSGYDAIESNGRRRSVSSQIHSEDHVLNQQRRRALNANAMDLHRNVGLASWAIRQHLNYVALFDFYACTKDRGLNADLTALMARDCKADACDIGGRHPWSRLRRLAEVRKTLDGDCGVIRIRSGHLQGIESAQIVDPGKKYPNSRWMQGVLLGYGNRATAYNVRETVGIEKRDRMVSADNMFLFGAFEGRFDQVRGISAFAAAMNEFRDLSESLDYARAKVKVEQLFALAITREKETDATNGSTLGRRVDGSDEDDSVEVDETVTPQVDFGRGPVQLNLDPGEDAKFLAAGNPSTATQDFLRLSVHLALLSLDIPMNFFDPAYVNMSGGRTTWNQYERSCVAKRDDQLSLHEWYTNWRLARWLLPVSMGGTGELVLPRSIQIADLRNEWVPRGVPWWKPQEELESELRSVSAGLDTPQRICRRHNLGDFESNLDEIQAAMKAAEERGLTLQFGGSQSPFTIVTSQPEA